MRKRLALLAAMVPAACLAAGLGWTAEPSLGPADETSLAPSLGVDATPTDSTEAVTPAPRALQGPTYEGARQGCRRCHLKQYRSWESTPHATAFETLPEDQRANPACVKCHVTGFGAPTGFQSIEATPELANVTCEACHGPGSLYKEKEVMEDLHASQVRGLVIPTEETCRGCHNPESPTFPGSFDFAEMLAKGVHEIDRG